MNRRELIETALSVGFLSAGGIDIKMIDQEPLPLLLVIKLDRDFDHEEKERIDNMFLRAFNGNPPCPFVICGPHVDIEAVIDPRSKP